MSVQVSAGRHIYREGVTANPARIEPSVDIVVGAEGVAIPVQVVHGAQSRRDRPHRPVTVFKKENLPPIHLAVNDFPGWARIERTRHLMPGTDGIVPIG
jgi:hypothetical protein